MSHLSCVAPGAWLSFIELDKAVVLVWLDWLVFCEYGFNVSALWCPLATPTVLLGFLLPWAWGISSRLLQQSAAAAPYLGQGYLLAATPPDLQHGIAPLSPPGPVQALIFGRGAAPLSHLPWSWAKGTFHAKMGSIKDRNYMDLTEAEDIKKTWQEYTGELYKKELHNPDNHDGVITHLKPDILEFEVKWALERITTNKAIGGDGIPVELFQILKDDAVKGLHSICQHS